MYLMPVAKKTTNNKTNKKVSIIQKLKLNTLKGRVLTTVLVFALVGGGVMVYRSFAATTSEFLDGNCSAGSSCSNKQDVVVAGKSATNVKVINGIGSINTNNLFRNAVPVNYYSRACVKVKFNTSGTIELWHNQGKTWDSSATSDYKDYCSDWKRNNTDLGQFPAPKLTTRYPNQVTSVSTFTVEISDVNPSAPAPVPCSGKNC